MEFIQIFTILALIFLDLASSQSLRRTVTQSSSSCTDAVKDYIGAQDGDEVEINYTGWLRDTSVSGGTWRKGKQFDSSEGGQPIKFVLGEGRVIKGWEEGLVGTCEGESLKLEIPSNLAYGDREVGGGLIPKNSDLIFELTLEKIKKGFRFITLEEKTCGKNDKTRSKDKVTFDYEQRLPDGTPAGGTGDFELNGNEVAKAEIGKTGIKGWDQGLSGMCVGEKRRVIIPPELGYGEKGVTNEDGSVLIPPNSVVVVDIKMHQKSNRVDNFLERISSGLLDFGR